MHANNPVYWYPWGEEAFALAREKNQLIIISIGYSSCHWCHVMEDESFSKMEVAQLMNEYFVSVKVDREERPDVDQVYMEAAQMLTGQGGWPLNAIALPDGRPVYAGTYFPKEQWMNLLIQIRAIYQEEPEKLKEQADAIHQGINSSDLLFLESSGRGKEFSKDVLHLFFKNWVNNIDFTYGGQNKAPKFPMPAGQEFLLRYHHLTGNEQALNAVLTTLNNIAMGGIYDHAGGGFARYSTDRFWRVPHFEKMLYDNAQLVSIYAMAWQFTKNDAYKHVVEETLSFIQREMIGTDGGFYSAIDADSQGKEGFFYLWDYDEFMQVLNENGQIMAEYFNLQKEGNWQDNKNILFQTEHLTAFAEKKNIAPEKFQEDLIDAKNKLLVHRNKRKRPLTDTKIITSWNAMMIKGFIDAYKAFGNSEYLARALENADFIVKHLMKDDAGLYRNHKDGKSYTDAFLDDYAMVIRSFISVYQATFDEKWLLAAKKLTKYALAHFYEADQGMFYYTEGEDKNLIASKFEISDNVIPSSNSVMASNLFLLGYYFDNNDFFSKSKKMLQAVTGKMTDSGPHFANWAQLYILFVKAPYEVAIMGENYAAIKDEFQKAFLPDVLTMGGKEEGSLPMLRNKLKQGQTLIYVCKHKTCKAPVESVEEALNKVMLNY